MLLAHEPSPKLARILPVLLNMADHADGTEVTWSCRQAMRELHISNDKIARALGRI